MSAIHSSPTMTIKTTYDIEQVINSKDFISPEFEVEVETSFGKYTLNAYNIGKGFVLECEYTTPTLCRSSNDLPYAVESQISELENNLDTMT